MELSDRGPREALDEQDGCRYLVRGEALLADVAKELADYDSDQLRVIRGFIQRERRLLVRHTERVWGILEERQERS